MSCEDCFARGIRSCRVLNELICLKKAKCSFYKTKRQHEEDLKRYPVIDYSLYHETGEVKYIDTDKRKAW